MSTTAAGTRSWPKERRSQTGPYSNDGTTIGPAGSERRPPRCPLTKGPKSPKVADDVQLHADLFEKKHTKKKEGGEVKKNQKLTDDAIVKKAMNARNGVKFQKLWN